MEMCDGLFVVRLEVFPWLLRLVCIWSGRRVVGHVRGFDRCEILIVSAQRQTHATVVGQKCNIPNVAVGWEERRVWWDFGGCCERG